MELFTELTVREHLVVARRVKRRTPAAPRFRARLIGFGERPRRARTSRRRDPLLARARGRRRPAGVVGPARDRAAVEVARALASEPSVMLLDEPSSGLDVHETEQLGEALRRVRQERGTAFVLVEHNVEFVLNLSDRVTVLDFGQLLARAAPTRSAPAPRCRPPTSVRRSRSRGGVTDAPRRIDRQPERRWPPRCSGHRPPGRVPSRPARFGVTLNVPQAIGHRGPRRQRRGQVFAGSGHRGRGDAPDGRDRVRRRRHHRPPRAPGFQARARRRSPRIATSSPTSP